jgi:predicted nucleotidyltransferase
MLNPDVVAYQDELVARLRTAFDETLVGVYAGGSWALGDYEPGRSDLDVAAVVRGALPRSANEAILAAVRHEALPCPARGLELVVYSDAAAATSRVDADFELNLNTGAAWRFAPTSSRATRRTGSRSTGRSSPDTGSRSSARGPRRCSDTSHVVPCSTSFSTGSVGGGRPSRRAPTPC